MPKTAARELVIRPYRDEDFSAITGLEVAGVHEPYRSAVFVRQMAVLSPATFLVAVSGTKVAGFTVGAIGDDDPGRAWILRMMVRDGFRHRGVGTALLRAVIGALEERSVRTICLTVAPGNMPAVQLYRTEGFVQESFRPDYFGDGEDRVVMKRTG